MRTFALAVAGVLAWQALSVHAGFTVDFEDVFLPSGSYYNGSDRAGGFSSRGAELGNAFDDSLGFDYWRGFAASAVNDPTTPGYGNQYASASGAGAGDSAIYGIGYDDPSDPERDTIALPAAATVGGLHVNNTAYAAWSMLAGDAFAKQFGGADGTDPDWFLLTIDGRDAGGQATGTIDVYLADYRAADPTLDYVLTEWTWVDLTSLGDQVATLGFSLTSSDVGQGGMNTPAYFAIDDLVVVPEPSVLALILFGAFMSWVQHGRMR